MVNYSQQFVHDLVNAIDESVSDSDKLKAIETFDNAIWLDLFQINDDDYYGSKFKETYTKILETMVRCINSDNPKIHTEALECIGRMSYKSSDKSPVYRHPDMYELVIKGLNNADAYVREQSQCLIIGFASDSDLVDELIMRPNFLEIISNDKFKFVYKFDLMDGLLTSDLCREMVYNHPNKKVRDFFEDYY